jgi:uncharacterized repeat protein (TIGR03803 family)
MEFRNLSQRCLRIKPFFVILCLGFWSDTSFRAHGAALQEIHGFESVPQPSGVLLEGDDGALYGTSMSGGDRSFGFVFRVTKEGDLTKVDSFSGTNGWSPQDAGLVRGADGAFYGTTTYGGSDGYGAVYRVSSNRISLLASFNNFNGARPRAPLVQGADGAFYGTTQEGGVLNGGNIFRVTTNGSLTALILMGNTNGWVSGNGLIRGNDGFLYGVGGTMASEYSQILRIATSGEMTVLTTLTNVSVAGAKLTIGSDGAFYGVTWNYGDDTNGIVYRCTSDGTLTVLAHFSALTGSPWLASLVEGDDGAFYGVTPTGGDSGLGTVYRVTTNGQLSAIFSFTQATGGKPREGLLKASDGKLYGLTSEGGHGGCGTVFRISTNAVFDIVTSFKVPGGSNPRGGLVRGPDQAYYGTTSQGGENGVGTAFRMTNDGSVTTLASFASTNGAGPWGEMIVGDDGAFYGTSVAAVFRLTTNGSLTRVIGFSSYDQPCGRTLAKGDDGTIWGSLAGSGKIFKVATNGLVTFFSSGTNYLSAYGGLIKVGNGDFYGVSGTGNNSFAGSVFRFSTNGQFTILTNFDYTNGAYPWGGLLLGIDGALYGTTSHGGAGLGGTVFRVTTNGGLSTLASFSGPGPFLSFSKLVQGWDGALYGNTFAGGDYSGGTIFRVTTNGAFTTLTNCAYYAGGARPESTLVVHDGGSLYGTMSAGGLAGGGNIFRLALGSQVRTPQRVAGGWVVSFTGLPENSYRLQRTTALNVGWTTLTNIAIGTNGVASYLDPDSPLAANAFYRTVQP